MANETDLKEFLSAETYCESLSVGPKLADEVRHWLSELLTAREYIPALQAKVEQLRTVAERVPAMEHSLAHYKERNEQLYGDVDKLMRDLDTCYQTIDQITANANQCAERIAELEEALTGSERQRAYLASRTGGLADRVEALDELLCQVTALVFQEGGYSTLTLREMLESRGKGHE